MQSAPETERRSPTPFWCVTTFWMLLLLVCFTIQQVVIVHMGKPYDAYLGLSGYGMKSCHLWELLTCQLLHCGLIQLLVNLIGLWFLGRAVEAHFGGRRFLRFCLGASLAGALFQGGVALTGFLLPESLESVAGFVRERFGGPVAGSSVGPCAILAAFCLARPGRSVRLWSLFPIQAKHLLWPALGVAVLLVVIPSNPDLAHIAHLGAMLVTVVIFRRGWLGGDAGS